MAMRSFGVAQMLARRSVSAAGRKQAVAPLSTTCRFLRNEAPKGGAAAPGSNEAVVQLAQQLALRQKGAGGSAKEARSAEVNPAPVTVPGQIPSNAFPAPSAAPASYTPDTIPARQDPLLQFLVNLLMRDGKKATTERYISDMLGHMAKLTNSNPVPLVYEAVEQARPILRMQSRKQGGKTMQVPIPLNTRQSQRRALMWIIEASRRRADRDISRRLAVEMLAVLEGNSSVISRKVEQHKIGMVNRANASVRI